MTALRKDEANQDALNIEGIEEIFEADIMADRVPQVLTDFSSVNLETFKAPNDITPEEAAPLLGKSVRTVRRMLEKGTLPGYKVTGKKRDEWRVSINRLSDIADITEDGKADADRLDDRVVSELRGRISQLEEQLEKANREIQAAAYRNGYLEAQAEGKDEQIKLLTDSQHNQRGWWAKFSSWFLGVR